MGIVDKAKQAAIAATVTKALDYLEKDPETNMPAYARHFSATLL